MAEEDTITVRVPAGMKRAVGLAAESRGMTLTGFVRQALQDALAPAPRIYVPPGLSPDFKHLMARLHEQGFRPEVILLVVDQGGHRAQYRGAIDGDRSSDSIVAISVKRRTEPWRLLARDIVGWFDSQVPAHLDETVAFYERQGWFPVTYPAR